MKPAALFFTIALVFGCFTTGSLRADQLQMQNGDRYVGKILSVSEESVILQSEVLGKVKLPRNKVANILIGTNAAQNATPTSSDSSVAISIPTNFPSADALAASANVDPNLAATPSNLAANPQLVRQVREQMLAGSPEAAAKFDELVNGFTSGKIDLNDLRREAKSSADQLRKLQQELGPEVGDALDGYLQILDNFISKTAPSTNASRTSK